jgi:hypothetical protein
LGTRQLQYAGIDRPTLAYRTFTSVIDTSAHFVAGSQNTLVLADGMLRKRPGFANNAFTSPMTMGTIKRTSTWERWDGTFFFLTSSTDGVNSYVHKAQWGQDTSLVLIHTSASHPQPFDFVVSRNLLFFGNGTDMLKYDGAVVSKWGTDAPTVAPTLGFFAPTNATASATVGGGVVTSLAVVVPGFGYDQFNPPQVTITGGGGTGATATATVAFDAVASLSIVNGGTGYTSAPTVTIVPAGINAYTGYYYGYTYTTIYGHESNMSPLSPSTGVFTGDMPTVSVTASLDPQVTGINVYRTTDGGSQAPDVMQQTQPNVIHTNSTQTIVDLTADINLGDQTGPALLRNSPPTPCRGFVFWNNRIWGFANGTTYFSGFEEIANGVAEEAWPAGIDGNFYSWPERVQGLGQTPDQLGIGLASQFWQITGDSLDTFREGLLLDKRGVRGVTGIKSVGSDVIWNDRSRQLWMGAQGEIGRDIRPDLATVDPAQSFVGMHTQGSFNWMYLLDPANHKLYIFDIDLGIWNTPWLVPGACAIASGEVSPGNVYLFIAFTTGEVCWLDAANLSYVDNGTQYAETVVTNLIPCGTGADATNRNRQEVGTPQQVEFETGPRVLESVALLLDEDPTYAEANWRDQLQGATPPFYQNQGQALIKTVYRASYEMQSATRAAMKFGYGASMTPWMLYSLALAYQV